MGLLFFIKITSNVNKYEQRHSNHKTFEKTRSVNAIKFSSFQRKPVNTINYALNKKRNNEAKIKIYSTIFKPINFKSLKKHKLLTENSIKNY